MTQTEYIQYLRTQAYWINHLATQLELGKTPDCEWAIDLPLKQALDLADQEIEKAGAA